VAPRGDKEKIMAKREPKSRTTTIVEISGRPGGKKGRIELSSGNLRYYRFGARDETLRLTLQQLTTVLEQEAEFRELNSNKLKLPRSANGDFYLEVSELDNGEGTVPLFGATSRLADLDGQRLELGNYQFSSDMAHGRLQKKFYWNAQLSVQGALWIVARYIDKVFTKKRSQTHTDANVVMSRQQTRDALLVLLKKLGI
jgi:hypothetical protein